MNGCIVKTHPRNQTYSDRMQEQHNLFSYILSELNESLAEFTVVSFHCGFSILTLCVLTADHVVKLRGGHQTIV